jgi:corin
METPLLPHHGVSSMNASQKVSSGGNKKILNGDTGNGTSITGSDINSNGNAALTKSISTPASLQTIVRFHHGSNMSLHHRVRQRLRVDVCKFIIHF